MLITRSICLIGLLLLAPALALAQAQRREFNYGTQVVKLTGRLVYRTFHGQPNYGETPTTENRETQPILVLDSTVYVTGKNNSHDDRPDEYVREITLVGQPENDDMVRLLASKPFSRKRVVVQGSLFHAHTRHHHTKVLMEVYTIKRARRK